MAMCPPADKPSRRPAGQSPILLRTDVKVDGIAVDGYYDPLHHYLCADSFSAERVHLSHTASDFFLFDWEDCRSIKVWILRHKEYHGQIKFYWPTEQDFLRGRLNMKLVGIFAGMYIDKIFLIHRIKDQETVPNATAAVTTFLRHDLAPTERMEN